MPIYKIILEDNNIDITYDILNFIPFLKKNLITQMQANPLIINNETISFSLKSVNSTVFSHIITVLKYKKAVPTSLQMFANNFINNMNYKTLADFIITTHKLEINDLMEIAVKKFKSVFDSNDASQIRNILKLEDDLSEAEYVEIEKDNRWQTVD